MNNPWLMLLGGMLWLIQATSVSIAVADTADLFESLSDDGMMSESELAAQRAGQDIQLPPQIANSEQRATLENNVLSAGVNGNNIVDRSSFSEAVGFTTVIQNSGNFVNIQDSTVVNVIFAQ